MSGFQIPGLGFAKKDETLPPLPPDLLAAAASFDGAPVENGGNNGKPEQSEDVNMGEDKPTIAEAHPAIESHVQPSPALEQTRPTEAEPMSVDDDDTAEYPSLTEALEAMIGGLDTTPPANTVATTAAAAQNTAPATEQNGTATEQQPEQQPDGEGEHPEWEVDSSPYELSSESSSDDSSSDDESESGEGYQLLGVEETARMLMEMEGGSDDEGGADNSGKAGGSGQLRTKNELAGPEAIPKPEVTLTPEDKIEELGVVEQIVENIMVVRAFTPGEYQVLDSGSVLCTGDRKVFGAVWETIGKVLQPMYTVLFSTAEEIKEAGLDIGAKVFYPTAHATFVFTQPLKNMKGSDASNIHDEEIAEDEMEFSDDEKEAEYKRQTKQKKRDARAKTGGDQRPARGGREPHPLRNAVSAEEASAVGGLNYDDEDDDGPYKPLTRPPGFGQVPPAQQTFTQEPESGRFNSRPRGGRGDFRGRGDRGRGGRGGRGRGGFGQRGGSRDGYSMPPQGQRHHSSPQDANHHQPPQGQWGGGNNHQAPQAYTQPQQQQQQQQQHHSAPAAPTFNFPFPGLPQHPGQPQGGFSAVPLPPPPPPPGWPAAQNGQAGQNPAAGAYINPAFFAALLSQMQQNQAQNGPPQPQQQQQAPPPQPPHQWGAQPPPR